VLESIIIFWFPKSVCSPSIGELIHLRYLNLSYNRNTARVIVQFVQSTNFEVVFLLRSD